MIYFMSLLMILSKNSLPLSATIILVNSTPYFYLISLYLSEEQAAPII